MYVLVFGNAFDGMWLVGLFQQADQAVEYAKESGNREWQVVPVALPESDSTEPEVKPLAYCVDGHEFENEESNLAGDGKFAPFMVFNIAAQDYETTPKLYYDTREEAQAVCDKLNAARQNALG